MDPASQPDREAMASAELGVFEALANEGEPTVSIAEPKKLEAPPITYRAKRLHGTTPIPGVEAAVADYWSWAYSDVMENVQRGTFAEFLVAFALGQTGAIRVGWTGFDVTYRSRKVEVKSSAYLQSWPLRKYSRIIFGFQRRQQWDPLAGTVSEPKRVADIYVFAYYVEKDAEAADVLDVSKWEFYVLPTRVEVERFETDEKQLRYLTLAQVKQIAKGSVYHADLKRAIDEAVDAL
jgi:hypothetical protein